MLRRLPGESDFEYHKRLVKGKLVDKTLADVDYAEMSEAVFGQPLCSDTARRWMYGSRYTIELLEKEGRAAITDGDILSEIDLKTMELQKERQRVFDHRNALNKLIRERARQEELNEILVRVVAEGGLPQLEYTPPADTQRANTDMLVSLNDIHYGAVVNNFWTKYDSDICREMFRRYLDEIIAINATNNCENCIVWANGDLISGNIHHSIAVTNKEDVIQQVVGVSELIAEFLSELSQHFATVRFVSVAGNHSRIEPNKDKALVNERLDDLIEWYLGARLQNFANVLIGPTAKVDSTMYLLNVRGKIYCGVHGDFDGTPSKIQSLQTMAGMPLYAVLSGHLHHNSVNSVQGIKNIMAGSFLGMDDYCVQKRIVGRPEQLVCLCDETGVRCYYDISLR